MSCTQPKTVLVQEKITPVPALQIDTCFVYKRDTAFIIETDTFRIETIIRDTLISQHIETKPFFITRIDTIRDDNSQETERQLKKENKEIEKKERMVALSFLVLSLVLILSLIKKNK